MSLGAGVDEDLIYRFPDREGTGFLDFSLLCLPREISLSLRRALIANLGHNAFDTQRKAFQALKLFAECLRDARKGDTVPLDADVLYRFADWLDESQLGISAQPLLNTVKRLLTWCQRNIPDVVSPRATFTVRRIRTDVPKPRKILDKDFLKEILRACYAEIDSVEKQYARSRALLEGQVLDPADESLSTLITELLPIGGGRLPKQRVVNRSGNAFARRIEDFGGHRTLTKLLWLSSEAMFPFYLAVLVQTSGNPDAIKELTRSCIVPHPLRSDLERLVWFKQRSSSEQRADFPAGRAWSAPSLVRRLCLLNECLLPWCEQPRLRDRVFICYNGVHRTTSIPSPSTFQDALINFIARNRLPAFQLKDIRSSGAVEHHLAAGTVNAAKERLNHKSLATTTRYTSLADRRDEHDRVIRHFQGEIVRLSMLTEVEPTMANASFENVAPGADTVFGFRCKDPWSGLAPGSTPGSPCLQFSRCATCPGALIPVDDPVVVARLLATLSALEETRKLAFSAGWSQRYLALYEPTREILISQVLPAVHPAIKEIAMSLNVCQVVPPLE